MKHVVIVTDSSSGITQAEGQAKGITVIPIPFTIDGKEYLEDKTITAPKFFEMLAKTDSISISAPMMGSSSRRLRRVSAGTKSGEAASP